MDQKAFFALSCGLYVVSAVHEGTARGCVVNTVQQVTSSPAQLSVTVNKENATAAWIAASGRFCAAVLTQSVPMNTIAVFASRRAATRTNLPLWRTKQRPRARCTRRRASRPCSTAAS